MTTEEMRQEALGRARGGLTMSNYPTIIGGFMAKGIPAEAIEPRVNVFTYEAWRALGRHVRRGEHGVRVLTWIPIDEKKDADGTIIRKGGTRPRAATVFHVSQTDPDTALADKAAELTAVTA